MNFNDQDRHHSVGAGRGRLRRPSNFVCGAADRGAERGPSPPCRHPRPYGIGETIVIGYMKYSALVPVKALAQAKSRLAPYLSSSERESLVLDMLAHVLQVLRSSGRFEHISVVSEDRRVLSFAAQWDAIPLFEEQHGHNPALSAAAMRELTGGVKALLTISADLPLLTVCDINAMCTLAERFNVVLAPSREGTGTNALLTRPPLAIPYLFGSNSRERHLEAARDKYLSSTLHHSYSLAFDVDTIEDVRELQRANPAWRERREITV
jgi:2-phospho-L-lactate guanylyltransferase